MREWHCRSPTAFALARGRRQTPTKSLLPARPAHAKSWTIRAAVVGRTTRSPPRRRRRRRCTRSLPGRSGAGLLTKPASASVAPASSADARPALLTLCIAGPRRRRFLDARRPATEQAGQSSCESARDVAHRIPEGGGRRPTKSASMCTFCSSRQGHGVGDRAAGMVDLQTVRSRPVSSVIRLRHRAAARVGTAFTIFDNRRISGSASFSF